MKCEGCTESDGGELCYNDGVQNVDMMKNRLIMFVRCTDKRT